MSNHSIVIKERKLQLGTAQNTTVTVPKVGMIVLSTDLTFERDVCRLKQRHFGSDSAGFDYFVNRIAFSNPMTKASLRAMLPEISATVAEILPDEVLDAVVFNCTSASALLGDKAVTAAIRKIQPDAAVLTTASASVQHILSAGHQKISLLTPYNLDVSRYIVDYFQANGLQIASLSYLDIDDDRDVGRLEANQILEAAQAATAPDADALFISCTATRAAEILPEIEATISKPCFSSNHSTFMQTLRAVGLN